MIIVRSPLRISLGGGGTDLASYYIKKNGFVISAAIDKYLYVRVEVKMTDGQIAYFQDCNVYYSSDATNFTSINCEDYSTPIRLFGASARI